MKRILLVSVLVLALMVVPVACASESDESRTKDTVNTYFSALNDKNCEKALDCFAGVGQMSQTEKDTILGFLEGCGQMAGNTKITVKSIDVVEVTGSTATASVVVTVQNTDSPA